MNEILLILCSLITCGVIGHFLISSHTREVACNDDLIKLMIKHFEATDCFNHIKNDDPYLNVHLIRCLAEVIVPDRLEYTQEQRDGVEDELVTFHYMGHGTTEIIFPRTEDFKVFKTEFFLNGTLECKEGDELMDNQSMNRITRME